MKDLFHIIEDAQVILRSRGTFFQRKVYWRGNRIYAAYGGGFIRLGGGGSTSKPNVSCESLDLPPEFEIVRGACGEPLLPESKPIMQLVA